MGNLSASDISDELRQLRLKRERAATEREEWVCRKERAACAEKIFAAGKAAVLLVGAGITLWLTLKKASA